MSNFIFSLFAENRCYANITFKILKTEFKFKSTRLTKKATVRRTHYAESSRQNKTACPTSIRKKSNTVREQSPRICKKNNSKINCESARGQHLIANPESTKTYIDDNFRFIGQARSSFQLSVLESVYIKTQNTVFCKEFAFSTYNQTSSTIKLHLQSNFAYNQT